jgi:hypothetical protein
MSQQPPAPHSSTSSALAVQPATALAEIAAAKPSLPDELFATVQDVLGELKGVFASMEWAEEEIRAARRRHPAAADAMYHSFSLLTPQSGLDRMATEFVFRSHCRELLNRVARGEDTRPGTAAEVCCAMMQTSMLAPLRSSAAGLYMRMWTAAGFPEIEGFAPDLAHHEALEKTVIDEHEALVRRKVAVADRRLGNLTCQGLHHGEAVACVYAKAEQLALTG